LNIKARDGATNRAVALDIYEKSEGTIIIQADMPGCDPGKLDVTVEKDRLTLAGTLQSDSPQNHKKVFLSERPKGEFRRTIRLPFEADAERVEASYDQGVLTITIHKMAELKRRITIKSAEDKNSGSQEH